MEKQNRTTTTILLGLTSLSAAIVLLCFGCSPSAAERTEPESDTSSALDGQNGKVPAGCVCSRVWCAVGRTIFEDDVYTSLRRTQASSLEEARTNTKRARDSDALAYCQSADPTDPEVQGVCLRAQCYLDTTATAAPAAPATPATDAAAPAPSLTADAGTTDGGAAPCRASSDGTNYCVVCLTKTSVKQTMIRTSSAQCAKELTLEGFCNGTLTATPHPTCIGVFL